MLKINLNYTVELYNNSHSFLSVIIARVVAIPVVENKEECGVSIKGKQHWSWLIILRVKLISQLL